MVPVPIQNHSLKSAPGVQKSLPSSPQLSPKSSLGSSSKHSPGHRSPEIKLDRKQRSKCSLQRNLSQKQNNKQFTATPPPFGVPRNLAGITPAPPKATKRRPRYTERKSRLLALTQSHPVQVWKNQQQQHRIPKIAPCSCCRCLCRMAPGMDPS